jgi:hypothetical protein
MAGYIETGATEQEMTAVEYAALPIQARIEIWAATKSPTRHIRNDCLSNASYSGIHAALGPIHELSLRTLFIRTGLALGFSRTWDAAALATAVNRRTIPRTARR